MKISGTNNLSKLKVCREVAHRFLLSQEEALAICDHLIETIRKYWDEVCAEAQLSEIDRKLLWQRQFLNPFVMEEYDEES